MKAIKAWLDVGRVSNLPTVWTNCLVAWLLERGTPGTELAWMGLGASLLYLAGTTWNDAFDAAFDRRHRGERPIPSGLLSPRAVWTVGGLLLAAGLAVLFLLTSANPVFVAALAAAIVFYDFVHKRSAVGIWVMGACRFLLYLVAASAVSADPRLVEPAAVGLATGLYVVGLSAAARGEATGGRPPLWGVLLLAVPVLLGAWGVFRAGSILPAVFLGALAGWILLSLAHLRGRDSGRVGAMVARLLAGIILVDAVFASLVDPVFGGACLILFLVTLGLQKGVPAT